MHHGPRNLVAVTPQHGKKVGMRIALMQEQWLLQIHGHLQLALEYLQLHLARRIVAVVIQPGFADSVHEGIVCKFA